MTLAPPAEPKYIDIGAGLITWTQVGALWEPDGPDDDPPFKVEIRAEYDEESGKFAPTSMLVERTADGPPVTSRGIPVASMVLYVARQAVRGRAISPTEINFGNALPGRKLPRQLDNEAWQEIAVVYRAADAFGNRGGQMLAEHYEVSRSTAAKWIREVKKRQLLEPVVAAGTLKGSTVAISG